MRVATLVLALVVNGTAGWWIFEHLARRHPLTDIPTRQGRDAVVLGLLTGLLATLPVAAWAMLDSGSRAWRRALLLTAWMACLYWFIFVGNRGDEWPEGSQLILSQAAWFLVPLTKLDRRAGRATEPSVWVRMTRDHKPAISVFGHCALWLAGAPSYIAYQALSSTR